MVTHKVNILRLPHGKGLPLPTAKSAIAAGHDLAAAVPADRPLDLAPGARALAAEHGITVLNAPGTIDADYRGEVKVLLVNLGQEPFAITRGLRIAQLVVAPLVEVRFVETDGLAAPARGGGGFRSTGVAG